jgi:hypothetical protein
MSKCHLCDKCVRVPRDIRHKLNVYRTDCRRAIKGKEYWSEHIKSLGVYEDIIDGCLRVRHRGGDSSRSRLQAKEVLVETRVSDDAPMKEYTEPDDYQSSESDTVAEGLKDDQSDDQPKSSGKSRNGVIPTKTDNESSATPATLQREDDELPQDGDTDEDDNVQSVKKDLSMDNVAVLI